MKRRSAAWPVSLVLAVLCAMVEPAHACQETLLEFQLSGDRVRLLNDEGQPMKHARVVVREAFGSARERTGWGTPVGKVVRRGKTDGDGYFSLKGLHGEHYWLTYDDSKNGESFFLSPVHKANNQPLELKPNDFQGVCHLFDIEHNTTKPPSGHGPIERGRAN
jgi:hypothetical protein